MSLKLLNLGCGERYHGDWTNVDIVASGPDVLVHDLDTGVPFDDNSFDAVYHSHVLEHFSKERASVFLEECFRVLKPGGIIRVVVPDLETIARLYLKSLEEALQNDNEGRNRYEWMTLELLDQMARHASGGAMQEYWRRNPMPAEDFVIERLGPGVLNVLKKIRSTSPQDQIISPNRRELALDPSQIGQFRISGEVHQWMYDRYSLAQMLEKAGFSNVRKYQANESEIEDFNRYLLDIEEDGSVRKPDSLFMEAVKPHVSVSRTHEKRRRRKIAIVNTYDIQGRAAKAAYRLHRALRIIGAECSMVTRFKLSSDESVHSVKPSDQNDYGSNNFFHAVIQNEYINTHRTDMTDTLFSLPFDGCDIAGLSPVVQADVINYHNIVHLQSLEHMKRMFGGNKPVVWTLHDQWAFTGGCHYSAGCKKYVDSCSECPQIEDIFGLPAAVLQAKKRIIEKSDITVVTPSKWLGDCARKSMMFHDKRIEVIPYSLETEVFSPVGKAVSRARLNLPADDILLLCGVDEMAENRAGVRKLIAALNKCLMSDKFRSLVQDGKVKIVCIGTTGTGLESLQIPLLTLDPLSCDEDIRDAYNAVDIFILPSMEENLPNTLLESLSCGTPVIAFNIGGIPDVLEHNVHGKLVPAFDSGKMAAEILSLVFDSESRAKMGRASRIKMEVEFNIRAQANKYLALFEDILARKRSKIAQEAVNISLDRDERTVSPAEKNEDAEKKEDLNLEGIYDRALLYTLKEVLPSTLLQLRQKQQEALGLQQEQTRLQQEQTRLQQEQTRLQQEQTRLQQEYAHLHQDNVSLQRELVQTQQENNRLQPENDLLHAEIGILKTVTPLVSVVTPVFNGGRWIEQCIRSVKEQDYPFIEHIIVDGGSTDQTLDICRRYPHLIIHSGKDRGQSHAINKGFSMAQGDILAWLCADDVYEPGAVRAAMQGILSGHDVVMGNSCFIDEEDKYISDHPANVHPYYDYSMFLRFWKYNPISQPAVFWRRRIWEACGPLRENLYFAMDYDLWLRMSKQARFERVNAYIAKYRIHPDAKCFSDNYGSKIELIQVSKRYWPAQWRAEYWKLYFHYLLTRNGITQHYSDGEKLLQEAFSLLDSGNRWHAVSPFLKAHFKHFGTPFLPGYKRDAKRLLKELFGRTMLWRFGRKCYHFLRRKPQ